MDGRGRFLATALTVTSMNDVAPIQHDGMLHFGSLPLLSGVSGDGC